jgi:glyoxylase-like metal-dependent hydrolase (beta-lactamase superfamily II)
MSRQIVRLFAATTALAASLAAAQSPPPFTLVDLRNGDWAAIDNQAARAASAGSNAGFVIGKDAVLVIDTFEHPEAARQMLAAIRQKTRAPIRFVVNTHYHLDHVGGNAVFSAAGATVMAQDNVSLWERTENLKFFGPKITPEQRNMVETLGLPDVTYTRGATVHLAGRQSIVLRFMPGHTGGDTVVFDPSANVVYCGDLFWNHTLPNLIDASTQPWIETLDTLLRDYPTAAFVPGHGDNVGSASDVRAFRDYLTFLREAVKQAQARGEKEDVLLKQVLPQIKEKYGSWQFFEFAEPDIQRTDEELRGVERLPGQPASTVP